MRIREPDEFEEISAHDLVQPLTAIKLQADMLGRRFRDGAIAPAELITGLDRIAARAGMLAERVASQLSFDGTDFAKGSDGALHIAPCDVVDVVVSVVANLDPSDMPRVIVHAPPTIIGNWDRDRLAQLVANLVGNALKYSGPDGAVRISLSGCTDTVRLDVEDDGMGMNADELEQLFSRGYRSPRAIVHDVSGLGFGLYGCRAIVEAHGGRIWAESDGEHRGARLHVTLPLQAA